MNTRQPFLLLVLCLAAFVSNACASQASAMETGPTPDHAAGQERVTSEISISNFDTGLSIPGALSTSPDDKHVAFVNRSNGKSNVVLDGKPANSYDDIPVLLFSANGQHLAYVARAGAKELVVLDGQEGRAYDGVENLLFSADSQHLAYIAHNASKWLVVEDDKEFKSYDRIELGSLTFSADGENLAYAAVSGANHFIVMSGRESRPYDAVFEVRRVDVDAGSGALFSVRYTALLGNQVLSVTETLK